MFVEVVRNCFDCLILVDSLKVEVFCELVKVGVDIFNDIWVLIEFNVLEIVVEFDLFVCIMYM